MESLQQEFAVTMEEAGLRLDRVVVQHFPELSRTRVQELIEEGLVLLNGKAAKDSHKVHANDVIRVVPQERPPLQAEPEAIPLDVQYEDDDVIAINKPAGMSVHAGAGNSHGTLVNALLGRGQQLSQSDDPVRPGIVHRLDKETSGILLVAKNDFAHAKLSEAFRQRAIRKIYIALVQGILEEERGRIELAIARDPNRRTRMTATRALLLRNSRPARTDWRVLAKIDSTSLLELQLHTGRTHQIRVHFSALRHPVVGDTLYGAAAQLHVGRRMLPALGRNFLHAAKIGFAQPHSGKLIELSAPLPADLREYLAKLIAAVGESQARIDAALQGFL
ncbi:MAG TPA: RluA family pseudouridine synthase [Candidatus Acidoferrales bacterium]|jgi:23S rRNA pseudouridine1911/1915/1917 synthase|nr:RluA family pseudouridine synthase [Candidatus Acidoferrales bacterium]